PDTVAAVAWAKEHSQSLCTQRDNYVFSDGICLPDRTEEINFHGYAEAFLGESTIATDAGSVAVNLATFIDNPFEDYLTAFALERTFCGDKFVDSSVGGIFPNGDAERVTTRCLNLVPDYHNF